MASVGEPLSRSPLVPHTSHYSAGPHNKTLPIVPVPLGLHGMASSAMEITNDLSPSATSMGPPQRNSPSSDRTGGATTPTPQDQQQQSQQQQSQQQPQSQQQQSSQQQQAPASNGLNAQPVGAAAAAQQPKVVQTAFIHKLYNMLEDHSIQHLISWSANNESFVMSPSSEFSKVLAQYFKHTNISSFVRQLNMYGFHKVSDVFHTSAPDAPLWEFKHGAGSFKRGDLVSLREIKRRASRHALIHRDSFSTAPKMPAPIQPGAPLETFQPVHEPVEARFQALEWNISDLHHRLARTEDAYHSMTSKCQTAMENLSKYHHWNQELSTHLLTLFPDPDSQAHRDIYNMRQEMARQAETLRMREEVQESPFSVKQPFGRGSIAGTMEPSIPLSPRQRPFDESRRSSLAAPSAPIPMRAPLPNQLQPSPRRYGSIGAGNGFHSPFLSRPGQLPPPPPPVPQPQHAPVPTPSSPMSLARRHTSADIRVHGWQAGQPPQPNHGSSPYASGQSSSAWPSSPRAAVHPGDQQLRDALSQYELPRATNNPVTASVGSRHASPPPPHETGAPPTAPSFSAGFGSAYSNANEAGWQLPGPKYPFKGLETPGTQTRRSSMASTLHSLLNPADTAEREGENEGPDERKRKRLG